ncbi:hypothetical protein [Pectobacterium polaris]|uniref:GAF domain-containing protein n=1 Tax=Pectobacterium polaris TaxID=2042057 RepID=A0AAW5GDK5_9GAMM|nr:hypothetical protein [Pectobacterium polaris]MCL6352653.1 hypothetical protein [Pectobacterium polaris]MCL6369864.1 hypothetical protein [Pectobacterium polaris]
MSNGQKESKFFSFSKKINNAISTASSTVSLSLGCAFVGGYDHGKYIEKISSDDLFIFNLISYILTNPYLYIIIGACVLILSEIGGHLKKNDLFNENLHLKQTCTENETSIKSLSNDNSLLKSEINTEQEKTQKLREEICAVHIKQVTTWLKGVYKQMNFTFSERVSIYFKVNQEFHILDRYSSNPDYKEIHKQKFSLNQGVISKAWQRGVYHELNAPVYSDDNNIYHEHMMKIYNFSENEISNLNMKSCRLLGVAITDADENIGVILFESTSEDSLTKILAEDILEYCKNYQSHLCGFVKDSIMYDDELKRNKVASKSNTDQEVLDKLGGAQ